MPERRSRSGGPRVAHRVATPILIDPPRQALQPLSEISLNQRRPRGQQALSSLRPGAGHVVTRDENNLKYRAFISYSRLDRDRAAGLQTRLEHYVLPQAMRTLRPG